MNDIVIVQVIYCLEDLSYCLRSILLRKLAVLADTIEKLPACSQLGHDVVLVLDEY